LEARGAGFALAAGAPPRRAAILARQLLPGGIALVVAESDRAARLGFGEKNTPAVFGHAHVAELRPALGVDADRGAQIDVARLEPLRTHVVPPLEELRLPVLERALQPAIATEVDVVRDPLEVIDASHHTRLRSKSLRSPVPYT